MAIRVKACMFKAKVSLFAYVIMNIKTFSWVKHAAYYTDVDWLMISTVCYPR